MSNVNAAVEPHASADQAATLPAAETAIVPPVVEVGAPPAVDDQRAELRAAINERNAILLQSEKLLAGITSTKDELYALDAEIETATANIATARANDADAIARSVLRGNGKKAKPSNATRDARLELEDVKDRRETLAAALERLDAELEKLGQKERDAFAKILAVRNELLSPTLEAMISKVLAQHEALVFARAAVVTLARELDVVPDDIAYRVQQEIRKPLAPFAEAASDAGMTTHLGDNAVREDAADRIREAVERLTENADAELPQL
jgi:hypothetical protein